MRFYGFVFSRDFVLLRCSLELSLNSRPHYENNASKVLVWLESSQGQLSI